MANNITAPITKPIVSITAPITKPNVSITAPITVGARGEKGESGNILAPAHRAVVVQDSGIDELNGVYLREGNYENNPRYTLVNPTSGYGLIETSGGNWVIRLSGVQKYGDASGGADTPDLVKSWVSIDSGADPTPTVRQAVWFEYMDARYGNVDNTSDLDKPISIATQIALDNKLDLSDRGKLIPLDVSSSNILNNTTSVEGPAACVTTDDELHILPLGRTAPLDNQYFINMENLDGGSF